MDGTEYRERSRTRALALSAACDLIDQRHRVQRIEGRNGTDALPTPAEAMQQSFPGVPLLGFSGSSVIAAARELGEYSHLLWQVRRRTAEHLWEDCWRVRLPGGRTLPIRATPWRLTVRRAVQQPRSRAAPIACRAAVRRGSRRGRRI